MSLIKSREPNIKTKQLKSSMSFICTNYTPPINRGNNISHESWELSYFEYLLDICDIFLNTIKEIDVHLWEDIQNSPEFLDHFSHFIFDNSSKYISPYIREISGNTENIYSFFKNYKIENGL